MVRRICAEPLDRGERELGWRARRIHPQHASQIDRLVEMPEQGQHHAVALDDMNRAAGLFAIDDIHRKAARLDHARRRRIGKAQHSQVIRVDRRAVERRHPVKAGLGHFVPL
ncbi:MAG: hypothetical protein ABIO86_20410 [Sphingomonas sp.]